MLTLAQKDPSKYPTILAEIKQAYPKFGALLPPTYDATIVDGHIANGQTLDEKIKARLEDIVNSG